MKTETIEYKDGDVTLRGYHAVDERKTGKRPGVLVMPEAFGLGAHAKSRAERLAELGYVAFAGDPYGNGIELADLPEAMKHAMPLFSDPKKFRGRGRAALDKLASLPNVDASRLAAIGFCMGGTFTLELARDGAPLRGIVSFHGGLQTQRPAEAGQVKAKVLVLTGANDTMIPVDQVNAFEAEMTKAGADWQVLTYGNAKHSFTNPISDSLNMPGIGYNKQVDERSWKQMAAFFEEIFAS
ncbi:MAG: dienelactone hydrolase family protein [Candidatus Binatus sp.]|uniref:dienelactone hydrolase family protein n=1 Tax=Candidatus Binatus sp. TaxID=2811406 RepID=UPI00271A6BDD|nr:dienelactone hydrolase family protein [Candidatus Binatus sp.]MDO8434083.1 dienelactone hydrolase family protein [Candidatus Binatus sp.]